MRARNLAITACVLAANASLALAQIDQRGTVVRWADYYATAYRVPPELVRSIIEVESGWQPGAVSSKGAAGLMQLMPATAVTFGVRSRFDAADNIRGGVAYLSHLLRLFRGDLRLALAAYIAGEKAILRDGLAYSSPEVFAYVNRVTVRYRARLLQRGFEGGASP